MRRRGLPPCECWAGPGKKVQAPLLLSQVKYEVGSRKFIWTPYVHTSVSQAETPATPPLFPHLGSYARAILVIKDRRHLFVTPRILQKLDLLRDRGFSLSVFLKKRKKTKFTISTSIVFILFSTDGRQAHAANQVAMKLRLCWSVLICFSFFSLPNQVLIPYSLHTLNIKSEYYISVVKFSIIVFFLERKNVC